MKIIRAKDYADVSLKAGNIIASVVTLKPDCVLGLATGSSRIGTYKVLIQKYENGELDFSQVKTVNLDEYVGLSKDHDQSYAYFMRTNLFDHVNIDQSNCNIPSGLTDDPETECGNYDKLIGELQPDLQLLAWVPTATSASMSRMRFLSPAPTVLSWLSPPSTPTSVSSLPAMTFPATPTPWASGASCRPRRS